MNRDHLKNQFPNGLVFGERRIARFDRKCNSAVIRVKFDTAYEVLGEEVLIEILEDVTHVLTKEEHDNLVQAKHREQ